MKAWSLAGPGRLELIEADAPKIAADDEALVKVEAVGVCGSDIHYYREGRIGNQVVAYPFRIGHECAGTVVDAGPRARALIGRAVAVDPAVSCLMCDQCRAGRLHTCRKLQFLGCPGQLDGCLAEFIVMPARNLYPVGDLDLAHAVVAEPLAVSIYAVRRARVTPGMKVGVLGCGPIGLCALAAAQAAGATVYATDPIDWRHETAAALGAAWSGNPERDDVEAEALGREPAGLDAVIEAAGEQAALDQAVRLLKPGGALAVVGIPEAERVSLPIHELRRKEIDVLNIRRQTDCTEAAVELLHRRPGLAAAVVTHLMSFEEAGAAFELVANQDDRVIKAIIAGR